MTADQSEAKPVAIDVWARIAIEDLQARVKALEEAAAPKLIDWTGWKGAQKAGGDHGR